MDKSNFLNLLEKYSKKFSINNDNKFFINKDSKNFPKDKIEKFLKNFHILNYKNTINSILGFYDTSFLGDRTGYLFFKDRIYYKETFSAPGKIWYDDIKSVSVLNIKKKDCDNQLCFQMNDGTTILFKDSCISKTPMCKFFEDVLKKIENTSTYFSGVINIEQNNDIYANAAGIAINTHENVNILYDEEKFHADKGHGFAAERANDLFDKLKGNKTKIIGDNNLKNGADRIVDDKFIQSKYCKTGSRCVKECFDKNGIFRYLDSTGKPMLIEVPSDKYNDAVMSMKDKIKKGKIPGITNPEEAKNIIKKGHFTYNQAKNIAKAGTIESLTYDTINGIITSSSVFGMSASIAFAQNVWNGNDFKTAIKNAGLTGIKVGGNTLLVNVLTNQHCKAGLNSTLVPSSEFIVKNMGSKASALLINAFRNGTNIYGGAAVKSAAKLLRCNTITAIANIVIFSLGDMISLKKRKLSKKQFGKNVTVTAASTTGSTVGMLTGGALGSTIPVVGNVVGAMIGGVIGGALTGSTTKSFLDLFFDDDSKELMQIINKTFNDLSKEYLLNEKEAEKSLDILIKKIDKKFFEDMFSSPDKAKFIKEIIIPIFENEVKKRIKLFEPSTDKMKEGIKSALEEISDDIGTKEKQKTKKKINKTISNTIK